jgi:hypothetical protein
MEPTLEAGGTTMNTDPMLAIQSATILAFVLALAYQIVREVQPEAQARRIRRAQKARALSALASLPLARMLARRSLPPDRFRQRMTPRQLQSALSVCGGCRKAAYCEAVPYGKDEPHSYAFCPNDAEIVRVQALERLA